MANIVKMAKDIVEITFHDSLLITSIVVNEISIYEPEYINYLEFRPRDKYMIASMRQAFSLLNSDIDWYVTLSRKGEGYMVFIKKSRNENTLADLYRPLTEAELHARTIVLAL